MTRTEAEIFIVAVSGYGDCMSVTDVLKKYRDVTLQEALEDNLGEIAQYCCFSRRGKSISERKIPFV